MKRFLLTFAIILVSVFAHAESGTLYNPATSGSGSGDVVGPASATNNAAVLFDGTTGKLVKDSTITFPLADTNVSDTLTSSIFIGSGSTTNAIDLGTAEVAGTLADGNVSDTLTSSIFIGSGSTTNAVDLATSEVNGILTLDKGGTGVDLSATGGSNQFVKQNSSGGVLTVGAIGDADVPNTITIDNATNAANLIGSGSTTNAVDLATAEVSGILSDANVADALTISGGTINNSIIGASTPAAGTFTSLSLGNDSAFNFGSGQCLWETADADANALLCALPEGDSTNVPGLIIADASSTNVDLGMFNGITDPFLAIVSDDQTKNFRIQHNGTNTLMTVSSGDILMSIQGANLRPATNDSAALGSASTMWSDLFLASGGVLDFNAGDVTITHSSNALSIDGASTITVNAKITQSGLTEFSSGTAMTASSYQCGRDNDATNQYHCNVPTGAGYEYSINDVPKVLLNTNYLSVQTGHVEKVTSTADASYNVATDDYIIHSTRSATGTQTINLPAAASNSGRVLIVKDAAGNAAANNITLDGNLSETIDGATTYAINGNYKSSQLYCDGAAWFVF